MNKKSAGQAVGEVYNYLKDALMAVEDNGNSPATKGDLRALEGALRMEIGALEARLRSELDARDSRLRSELDARDSRLKEYIAQQNLDLEIRINTRFLAFEERMEKMMAGTEEKLLNVVSRFLDVNDRRLNETAISGLARRLAAIEEERRQQQ